MSQAEAARPSEISDFKPGLAFAILAVLAAGVAMTWGRTADVWTTGAFGDTDDAMRMVQVRDLLSGQGWFDMHVYRLAPPAGSFMHWSRVVDVPLVALMRLFGLVFTPAHTEALTRLAFPLVMLAGLYLAVAHVARLFGDRAVQIAAVVLAFATGPAFAQFVPGRIDHHAPQIVLLMLASGGVIAALDPLRARALLVAAACMAVSLAISLENLPFFVVLTAIPIVAWIVRGDEQALGLKLFSAGLLAALPLCFVATVGPQRWTDTACDAYSATHLAAGVAGALALLGLEATRRWRTIGARFVGALAAGLLPLAAVKTLAPLCLGDPFVGLDPLVRTVWLDHVAEVQTLLDLGATQPSAAITLSAPLTLALIATLAASFFARGLQCARLLSLAALIAVGLAMTFWGVRVFSSVAPLAAIGAAAAILPLAQRLAAPGPLHAMLATALCLPFAPIVYAAALPADPPVDDSRTLACLRPDALKPLDMAPAGLVLAPIDEGSHLLAFTHHSVVAAPYHRNNAGNRLSIEAFLAKPDEARKIIAASGADYLVACTLMKRRRIMAAHAPRGLAAELLAGRAPEWLKPLDVRAEPNVIYRIVR